MFNLKEIKKVFLATFLLMAMVVFACPSYAEELDCSSKTGYEKVLCEQQQEINKKSQKSKDKIEDAQNKQKETQKKIEDKDTKADKKAQKKKADAAAAYHKYAEANKEGAIDTKNENGTHNIKIIDNSDRRIAEANKNKEQASIDLAAALKSGKAEDAKKAQEAMVSANNEINDAKKDAKEYKKAEKAVDKANEAVEKAQKKAEKAEAKAEKKVVDTAKKAEKSATKTSEKADKEVKKLQEKCEKNPEKCDTEALQAALAKQEAAKMAADAAKAQREDLDGTAEAREQAEKDRLAAEEAAANNVENAGDTEAQVLAADKEGKADAAAAPKRCAEAEGVFEIIACKAMTTLADLRKIVYIFAGFGLIAFAWSAIFNKISWKHFSQIAIALFLLSMMGTFIGYFGYDSTYEALQFGKYLKDDHEHTLLTGADGLPSDCDKRVLEFYDNLESNSGKAYEALGDCPVPLGEVTITAPKKKWSLKDLKGTVQAGIGAIQKANSAYQTAKSTVENVVSQAQTIGNAIKNGEGGLTGVLNTMNTVATASGSIMNSGQLLANNLAYNVGGLTEDIKTAGMTNKEREQRTKDKARLDTLTKMCDGGACKGDTPNAKKLRAEMEMLKGRDSTQDTAVNKWLKDDEKGGGATIMGGINKVGNIGNAATNTIRNASNAAQNGATIGGGIGSGGGDVLGAIFGAATVAGDITSMGDNPNFDFKSEGTKRKETAAAADAAHKQTSDYVASSKKDGDKTIETRGDGSTKSVDSKTGVTTVKNKDGSIVTTSKGGSTVEVKSDGTKIVTNSNGVVTTTTSDGKTSVDDSKRKVQYSGDAKISDQAKNKPDEPKKDEAPATSSGGSSTAASSSGGSSTAAASPSCPKEIKVSCMQSSFEGAECAGCKAEMDKVQVAGNERADAEAKAKQAEAKAKQDGVNKKVAAERLCGGYKSKASTLYNKCITCHSSNTGEAANKCVQDFEKQWNLIRAVSDAKAKLDKCKKDNAGKGLVCNSEYIALQNAEEARSKAKGG